MSNFFCKFLIPVLYKIKHMCVCVFIYLFIFIFNSVLYIYSMQTEYCYVSKISKMFFVHFVVFCYSFSFLAFAHCRK